MAENILALIEMSVVFAMNAQEKLLLDVALAALIISFGLDRLASQSAEQPR